MFSLDWTELDWTGLGMNHGKKKGEQRVSAAFSTFKLDSCSAHLSSSSSTISGCSIPNVSPSFSLGTHL